MTHETVRARVRDYYTGKLRQHGPTPAGADWNSQASQTLRFEQLAQLWRGDDSASIIDYGCGYGAMAAWLRERGHRGAYTGFDMSAEMVAAAERESAALPGCRFTADRSLLDPATVAVASGIFNVRLETGADEWLAYMLTTIADLARLGRRGFAFNALTLYSDADHRRPDLYYADPLMLFDHCKRHYSRFVSLLHDYELYEFTLLVRS